jgi:phosphatidylserine/phosphatidylglycerophosphate/cardiolipin synthase-like enzyme
MLGSETSNSYYSGSETYKYLERLLERSGDILLISPYIDTYYAEMVSGLSRNKHFYIISSSAEVNALNILKRKRSKLPLALYAMLSIAIALLMLYIRVFGPVLSISFVPFIVGLIKYYKTKQNIFLKIPKQFVHAKSYIADGMAITGSANLTYKGTHKNIEQISVTYNGSEICLLRKQFWSMWKSL